MTEPGPALAAGDTILTATGISKSFGGVHALTGVDLTLRRGTVLAIAGENGAGKSTLIKTLTGVHQPDEGTIVIDGTPQTLSPASARQLGIAAVAQELSVLDHQSVAENITLGQAPLTRLGFIDRRAQRAQAEALLDRLRLQVSPHAMVRDLTLAQKQMVEISKAMVTAPRILILDEPTSGLREDDVRTLLDLIKQLRDEGTCVVLVTHRMSEMFECSDQIMVLKDGRHVGTRETASTSEQEIVRLMVGRELSTVYPDKPAADQAPETIMSVEGFSVPGTLVHDVSLDVPRGRIVALAGLAGHGQTHLLEGIAGLRPSKGDIVLNGRRQRAFGSVASGIRTGVVLIPEDRKTQGRVLPMNIGQTVSLPTVGRRAAAGWISSAKESQVATEAIETMEIRPPDERVIAGQLSGGNQQKIVIGKWLVSNPAVVLCADPTRGIDVGTKQEIYGLLRRLSDQGVGVLMLSTDLTEVVGLADIVHVMAEGQIVRTLVGDEINDEAITGAAFQAAQAATESEEEA